MQLNVNLNTGRFSKFKSKPNQYFYLHILTHVNKTQFILKTTKLNKISTSVRIFIQSSHLQIMTSNAYENKCFIIIPSNFSLRKLFSMSPLGR